MAEMCELRLDIIKDQLEKQYLETEIVLKDFQANKISIQDANTSIRFLKAKHDRYVTEMHMYIRIGPRVEYKQEFADHTKLQLQCENLLSQMEDQVSRSRQEDFSRVSSKLPKLELLKYKGEISHWYEFWDRFSSSVHSKNIRAVDKLSYLQACLEGPAKEAVIGLETTDANYEIAIKILTERFGRKTLVIDTHYKELYDLKRNNNSIKESRRILNEVERHLRILGSFGENIDGAHLRIILIQKFPDEIIKELRTIMKKDDEPIHEIRKNLQHLITAREMTSTKEDQSFTTEILHVQENHGHRFRKEVREQNANMSSQNFNRKPFQRYKQKENKFKTSVNYKNSKKPFERQVHGTVQKRKLYTASYNNKKTKFSCIFCNQPHYNDECKNVTTFEERKAKLDNKCYKCFREGHTFGSCQNNKKCPHCGKIGKHNRALCPKLLNNMKAETTSSYQINHNNDPTTILQTAIAYIKYNETFSPCRILLDTGSQRSYVTTEVIKKLKLPFRETRNLLIFTFGTNKPINMETQLIDLELKTKRGTFHNLECHVVKHITNGVSDPGSYIYPNSRFDLADDGSLGKRVDILIGNNYYHEFLLGKVIKTTDTLYLLNSYFGWIYSGRINDKTVGENSNDLEIITYYTGFESEKYFTKPDLPFKENVIERMWDLDAIGITDSPKATAQEEIIKYFNDTIEYHNNRYYVKFPWVQYPPNLPTNYGLAYGRLKSVIKRMSPENIQEYDNIFKYQIKQGIIEVIKEDNLKSKNPIHYLSHHAIQKEGKQIRIVLDGSAKLKDSYSLNECLYKGPLMLEDLTALLIKFRQHKTAITADIEKAFLQVGLLPADRDVTRLIWLKNIKGEVTEDNLLYLRFCRVPFGIVSSPFLLTATIHYHLNRIGKEQGLVEMIAKKCYVDNLVTSVKKSEAIELYKKARNTFQLLSMNIRDWGSNDMELLKKIPNEYQEKNKVKTNLLGMIWNKQKDVLQLKLNIDTNSHSIIITKREVLKKIASVYDPCGFLTPALLPCKLFLQDLWIQKVKWDSPLCPSKQKEWHQLDRSLKELNRFEFPRYFGQTDTDSWELHCFTDASQYAYAAVVYISGNTQGETLVKLVMSKSRLTPIKEINKLQIPKLELLGFLIGSRLLKYVKSTLELNITKQYLWTDSLVVLSWINSNKLLSPFIARRINEIKQNIGPEFKHVGSQNNPADVATKKDGIKRIHLWIHGPKFLKLPKEDWPKTNLQTNLIHSQLLVSVAGEGLSESENKSSSEPENIKNTKNNTTLYEMGTNEDIELEDTEGNKDKVLIKKIQKEYYPKEVQGMQTSLKIALRLFKDKEGILRCKGRMGKSTWSYDMKFPILLPGNAKYTENIIKDIHVKNYHVGTTHTLSLVRQHYWIPKGRKEVQKVLRKCPQCIKHGGGPFKLPDMPPLPEERITLTKPFDYSGMDYFGPIYIKSNDNSTSKMWVCLYTCLATRAIHMEVVRDLTSEECLLAFRRFVSSRGIPILITSDNATQFKMLAEVINSDYCVTNQITWRFIPELAPWHGGFYERLIGLVKNCLKRTLEKHILNTVQFTTIIKEIEAVINSRPLTYVSTELEHILRPNDFLINKCLTFESSSIELLEKESDTKARLIESWKRGLNIMEEFSKMFVNQYLVGLREKCDRHKEKRVNVKRVPKVGETVQIKDDSSNRSCWKVGKITELIKSKDGEIRVAKVKANNKEYNRSISHLYPLEIDDGENNNEEADKVVCNDKDVENENDVFTGIHMRKTCTKEIISGDERSDGSMGKEKDCEKKKNENEKSEVERVSKRKAAEYAKRKILQWTKQLLIL